MGVEVEEDLKRKMIELNLTAARLAQSPQTGYVHLNYEVEERHDTIPLLENFCFALALFRSRISDNVVEGKTLLEKLLVFEVDGNFPVYLHEYPECKDRDFSLSLLPIFHWLLTDFSAALGDAIKLRLETLIGRILSHNYKMHAKRPLCKSSEYRLKSYFQPDGVPSWVPSDPTEWAEALITWQMAQSRGVNTDLMQQALEKWHSDLCTWIAPQQQERGEPKVTLIDLILGHYYDSYSSRALKDRRTHLLAALIQPFAEKILRTEAQVPCHAFALDSEQPYALYWGTLQKLHSFYLDPKGSSCTLQQKEDSLEFTLMLPPKTHVESQDTIELAFFLSLVPDQQILVNGMKATTFQLADQIDLNSDTINIGLKVEMEKGEGKFFGHLLRGNRPNQKGKNLKYETYDWQIALRTICRSEECVLKVTITL